MTKHALLLLAAATFAVACSRDNRTTPSTTDAVSRTQPLAADDTGKNVRDRGANANVTPIDQSADSGDVDITRNIRKALTVDSTLSTDAQNVKIVTNAGSVVLRGPVDSAGERAAVVSKAQHVPGVTRVEDDLEVVERPNR